MAAIVTKPKRVIKPKSTFMLHSKTDFTSLGKYSSSGHRYAALKAASRGFTTILLRKTNSKIIYEYAGEVVKLDTPQEVMRGERSITYSKKPVVKFVRKFTFEGEIPEDEVEDTNDEGASTAPVAVA